jgi:hypothetical protein
VQTPDPNHPAPAFSEVPNFRDVYYVTTYNDPQAVAKPRLRPRQADRLGPFDTYGEAVEAGCQAEDISHFKVDKVYVHPLVIVH